MRTAQPEPAVENPDIGFIVGKTGPDCRVAACTVRGLTHIISENAYGMVVAHPAKYTDSTPQLATTLCARRIARMLARMRDEGV